MKNNNSNSISFLYSLFLLHPVVVCKLLVLGHAGLGHAELGQQDWDMRNWDSGTGTRATRTAKLGHAELGQRYWDSFYSVKMGKIVVCV